MYFLRWDPSDPNGNSSEQTGFTLQERNRMGGFEAENRVFTLKRKCSLEDGQVISG